MKENKTKIVVIFLIIAFSFLGVYLFVTAMKSNFLSTGQNASDNVKPSVSAKVSQDQTDISNVFQKDPFEQKCNENSGKSGTSVSSNTVCIR